MNKETDYIKSKYFLCATLIDLAKKVIKMNGGKDIVFTTSFDNERRDNNVEKL